MKWYLKVLAFLYFVGGALHVLDLLDLRLKFSEMDLIWKTWIVYLVVFDFIAAIGLWKGKAWGVNLYIFIAVTQLVAYSGMFQGTFGNQEFLVAFHVLTLILYVFFKRLSGRSRPQIP